MHYLMTFMKDRVRMVFARVQVHGESQRAAMQPSTHAISIYRDSGTSRVQNRRTGDCQRLVHSSYEVIGELRPVPAWARPNACRSY
jgi:hypothetical protein